MKNKLIIITILLSLFFFTNEVLASSLKIHEFDVYGDNNHWGDAALVESANSYMLIDTSTNGTKIVEYLEKRNIKNIDILLTHMHGDHTGGYNYIINSNKVTVRNLYISDPSIIEHMKKIAKANGELNAWNGTKNKYNSIVNTAKNKGANIVYLRQNDKFTFGDANVEVLGPVLYPPSVGSKAYVNNFSLCTKFIVDEKSFLTCGDIQKEQEEQIIASGAEVKSTIFKMNHHGNLTSGSAFIDAASPDFSFRYITYGDGNKLIKLIKTKGVSYGSLYNGIVDFEIRDNNVYVTNIGKNTKTLTFEFIDKKTNKLIQKIDYPFPTGDTFNPNHNWYKLNIDDYSFNSINISEPTKISSNKTIKVYYESEKEQKPQKRPIPAKPKTYTKKSYGETDCKSVFGDPKNKKDFAYFLQSIFNIIKYLGVILTIVLSIIDFLKATTSNDKDALAKAFKTTGKRIIFAFILFFLPILINYFFGLVGLYGTCDIK